MNYLEHTTTYTENNTEYKHVRLQTYNERGHKGINKFFINGKQVRNHERWVCEQAIDNNTRATVFTERRWTK